MSDSVVSPQSKQRKSCNGIACLLLGLIAHDAVESEILLGGKLYSHCCSPVTSRNPAVVETKDTG
ncbi:MAG: hypothetical protein A2341_15435 [Deltaproteobacteria bacterium RIFOXYB12_FULL_58_9]|nr:MAG: hypothetical protein A2341_15435 [Deltaproteobacteria bacterium RIFOXYB12_FULL_58_9]